MATRPTRRRWSAQVEKLKDRFRHQPGSGAGGRSRHDHLGADRRRPQAGRCGLDHLPAGHRPFRRLATENGPLQLSLFDERDLAEISAPDLFPGERLIVCRNRDLAAERARKREELLAATERELLRIQAQVRRRHSPLRSAAEIGLAVGGVVNSRKMAKTLRRGDPRRPLRLPAPDAADRTGGPSRRHLRDPHIRAGRAARFE